MRYEPTGYNMPDLGLFGKRCIIPTDMIGEPIIYRIVNSGLRSNVWSELPLTYQTKANPTAHDYSEDVLIVVCDTLIDQNSRLIRVALKDVEIVDDRSECVFEKAAAAGFRGEEYRYRYGGRLFAIRELAQ